MHLPAYRHQRDHHYVAAIELYRPIFYILNWISLVAADKSHPEACVTLIKGRHSNKWQELLSSRAFLTLGVELRRLCYRFSSNLNAGAARTRRVQAALTSVHVTDDDA